MLAAVAYPVAIFLGLLLAVFPADTEGNFNTDAFQYATFLCSLLHGFLRDLVVVVGRLASNLI